MAQVVHRHGRHLDRALRARLRRPARRRQRASWTVATGRPSAPSTAPRSRSSPDVLGLISWNEFSENTHVEPSEQFGDRYVQRAPRAASRRRSPHPALARREN